ncbi:MAG: alpha-L-fucosidase [Kiritimatiellia bacterium]
MAQARFGMFVHWGLYSGLAGTWEEKVGDSGGMEWIQQRVGVDTKTYAAAALPKFKPRAASRRSGRRRRRTPGANTSCSPPSTTRASPCTIPS